MKLPYPVDYGYLKGIVNPDDNEDLDVFYGNEGMNYGRFMKGKNLSGQWEPDERKWYYGLSDEQLAAVRSLFDRQSPELLKDFQQFSSPEDFLADISASAKAK